MDEIRLDDQESQMTKAKQWFQDNLRIIISIAVVILIAGGIYSYSKRGITPELAINDEISEEIMDDLTITGEEEEKEEAPTEEKATTPETKVENKEVIPADSSSETAESFIETAVQGNGATHLARRALANYLEKNPDSQILPEHKIYIEDYLRKNISSKGSIHVGTTVEFQKDLIENAIEKAKSLNDAQVKNLHKYVLSVPSLS